MGLVLETLLTISPRQIHPAMQNTHDVRSGLFGQVENNVRLAFMASDTGRNSVCPATETGVICELFETTLQKIQILSCLRQSVLLDRIGVNAVEIIRRLPGQPIAGHLVADGPRPLA